MSAPGMTGCCAACSRDPPLSRPLPPRHARGDAGQAPWPGARRPSAGWRAAEGDAGAGAGPLAHALGDGGAAAFAPVAAPRGKRVAILSGCAQPVLDPAINEATIRLLTPAWRRGRSAEGRGLLRRARPHMGREHDRARLRRNNIDAWMAEIEGEGLDAILITASGCGTTIKDYGFMFRNEPGYAEKAAASRAWRRTSPNSSRRSSCRLSAMSRCRSPTIPPARCSMASS